jgi:hypothetical protein
MALDGQPFLDKIQQSAMASMVVDGKTYAIPTGLSTMGAYYNKKVFADHHVEIPKIHGELMEAARKFQAAGIYPFSRGFKEGWMAQADFQSDFYGAPLQGNPLFYAEIIGGTKKFSDYPALRESLVRYVDRLSFDGGDDFGTDAAAARANLLNGQAACIDGAGKMRTFWQIVFPMMKPILSSTLILNALTVWNDFQISLIISQRPAVRTIPLTQFYFFGQYTSRLNLAFAAFVLAMLPIILLCFLLQKYIIGGVMAGAIKG